MIEHDGTPILDACSEMRATGERDAEVFYNRFFLPISGVTSEAGHQPSYHFLHAWVASIAEYIPYPECWLEGFWGWWGKHGPA